MFGRMKTRDIPVFISHADAVMYWKGIRPIRGRGEDVRPIGMRRKDHMRIAMSEATGDVDCILYDTKVVTFHPDNTVTVRVPEAWRTNSTAQFIEAVLGSYRVNVGVKDNDVVMFLNPHVFRMGPETRFKLALDELELLGGNIVRDAHVVNRKVMNAARKDIKEFLTYLRGSHKVREGFYSSDEMNTLYEFLVKHKYAEANVPFNMFMSLNNKWGLSLPITNKWVGSHEYIGTWADRVKFVLKVMREGSHEDWYAVSLWLVASLYYVATARNVHVEFKALTQDVTDMLLVTIPDALIAIPEPYGEIKVDGNRLPAAIRKTLADKERYEQS